MWDVRRPYHCRSTRQIYERHETWRVFKMQDLGFAMAIQSYQATGPCWRLRIRSTTQTPSFFPHGAPLEGEVFIPDHDVYFRQKRY
jgi:hypothetical protein